MTKNKKVKKIITHSGRFHADDVFSVAVILLVLAKRGGDFDINIERTRDDNIIRKGNYVVDVGGIYNPQKNLFDHHQKKGAGRRKNGIPYASFGLVWKKFGKYVSGSSKVAQEIDKKLVQPVDALDNGVNIAENIFKEVQPYYLQDLFSLFVPSWKEKKDNMDLIFLDMVEFAVEVLKREITKSFHKNQAETIVRRIYNNSSAKKIIILDKNYPWRDVLIEYRSPLYVIFPAADGESWRVHAVPKSLGSFENRKDLPVAWAGKTKKELAEITGVTDAIHCHRQRFIASAKTKEGAVKLAKLAVENFK